MTTSNQVEVLCLDAWNGWSRKPYKYLRTGRTYRATELADLYVIRTPRGFTHYPKRLFRKVGPAVYEYTPTQEGDKADDI